MNASMRIGTRILAGYGLALLVVGAVGVVAYRATNELMDSADWVTHTHKVKESLAQLLLTMTDAETAQHGYLVTGEERFLEPYRQAIEVVDHYVEGLRELTVDNPNQQRRLATVRTLAASKLSRMAAVIELRNKNTQRTELVASLDEEKSIMDDLRRVVGEMNNEENDLLSRRDQRARATAQYARTAMFSGGLIVLVLVSIVGILIQRSITRPLESFMEFARRVGEGDLTQRAEISSSDELGDLATSLDQMVNGLKEMTAQVRFTTENLGSASAEILASTQQQAASTGEQAAAVQQTTITMEEVRQSGVQISERAKQVAASAESTASASHAGLQAMENTARIMGSISEQAEAVAENVVLLSEKTQAIAEIISTVNDLAEQSHLLALNAAIEAAAAGKHGRSFSVIASEVKNLADQSREATVQVRTILGDIQKGINTSVMLTEEAVKRVESGKHQADVAGGAIRTLAESIQLSVHAFQQIAAGSNQQQIGFTQVTQAVRDIGQASQQTASSTQQLEKAALNLNALSQQLQKTVERYQI
jgi:methyl-accepting chemotaxis protein